MARARQADLVRSTRTCSKASCRAHAKGVYEPHQSVVISHECTPLQFCQITSLAEPGPIQTLGKPEIVYDLRTLT